MVDKLVEINKDLLTLYDDNDSLLKEELSNMRGSQMFGSFYDNLNKTREYYQKFAPVSKTIQSSDIVVNLSFSGEEIFGKYLDLHEHFLRFCNIFKKQFIEQDYIQYLDRFNTFFYIPVNMKSSRSYSEYLEILWNYLMEFFMKIHPLINLSEIISEWHVEFVNSRNSNDAKEIKSNSGTSAAPQQLRLGMFSEPKELEALGMDRLKEALEALGLKCGGTLKDRAQRLWSIRGKKPEDIPSSLKAKGSKRKLGDINNDSGDVLEETTTLSEKVAWKEYRIVKLTDAMIDVVVATRKHAEKQQSRTAEEKAAEIAEEEFGLLPDVPIEGGDDDKDDDDAPVYNPLNIPLGWDGKPIPYWLYKLHGLGVEFKCEICGNQSYWGRRAFDLHFQEWKHAHGMRCLGVPNTKHFHDITSIEEVLLLYSKIKHTIAVEQFAGEMDEEFEDTEGNILNRRTYEDLARQGLL